jgi:hypothetical protein
MMSMSSGGGGFGCIAAIVDTKPGRLPDADPDVCKCGASRFAVCRESGDRICTACGIATSDNMDMTFSGMDYAEMTTRGVRMSSCGYKRSSYLRDWLSRVTASNESGVPSNVIDAVISEIDKHGLTRGQVTYLQIRHILRHLGLSRYYMYCVVLSHIINNTTPERINHANIERITDMFNRMQPAFERHKPKGRKNCLSYSYIIYQLCRIVNETELPRYLTLLRSSEKLLDCDTAWARICEECNWPFNPTI